MLFPDTLCLIRGGGDLATGVIYRLHQAGFPVVVLELARPRVVRRMASVAQAMFDGETRVEGLRARRMTPGDLSMLPGDAVPVVADPEGRVIPHLHPAVIVDARMAKTPLDTTIHAAPFVVGLGPGFVVGQHCHTVVETHRGHDMGRALWQGSAQPDTGRPEPVLGYEAERVLRAPVSGVLHTRKEIGEMIQRGQTVAEVGDQPIIVQFDGVLRGLMHDGLMVTASEKIGDLDPRGQRRNCFTISDKSLAVGGGVVEAVLTWLQRKT